MERKKELNLSFLQAQRQAWATITPQDQLWLRKSRGITISALHEDRAGNYLNPEPIPNLIISFSTFLPLAFTPTNPN